MPSSESDPGPQQMSYTFDYDPGESTGGAIVTIHSGTLTGSSAGLAARLWDLDPASGTQTLISRAVYRFEEGTSPTTPLNNLSFQLTPNAWQLLPGHRVKLELTQDDFPTWRPDNEPASLTINSLTLTLPMIPVPVTVIPEVPAVAALPLVATPLAVLFAVARVRRRRALTSAAR
jgi:predicted acyl esterase